MLSLKLMLFAQARQEVHILYDVFFERMTRALADKQPFPEVTRFILVRAFEEVFFPRLKMVSGYCAFIAERNGVAVIELAPHHWLTMEGTPSHIIDVLPVDGTFGVSCPQAVVHNESSVRFFEAKGIYSVDLSQEDIATVNGKIIKVVELLTSCMEKIPF